MTWRRLSDWKASVVLVHRDELSDVAMAEHGWTHPVERVRATHPELAEALSDSGFVRVSAEAGALLNTAGVFTTEVGYHRGSDGLELVDRGADGEEADGICVTELGLGEEHEISDVVDAVLRVWTEDLISERTVLLAAAAPALDDVDFDPEHLDVPDLAHLPHASEALLDAVATALQQHRPFVPGPLLTPSERRAYQRQVAMFGALAAVATLWGLVAAPMLLVLSVPALALCSVIYAIHWAVLRQEA